MKLTLEAIELIEVIAKKGSFAKAAETLFKAPSTISYAVSKVEEQLGLILFTRNGPHITLTPIGKTILEEGKLLLNQLSELENRLDKMSRGVEESLTITLDAIFPIDKITPLIIEFNQSKANTRLKINRAIMMGAWESLLNFNSDLIVAIGEEPAEESGYSYQRLGHIPFVFCVAPHHPLASHSAKLTKHELQLYPAIVIEDSAHHIPARSVGIARAQDRILVSNFEDKIALQKLGVGHGFLPQYLAEPYIQSGELIAKEIAAPSRKEPLFLVWRNHEQGIALNWWREALSQLVIE